MSQACIQTIATHAVSMPSSKIYTIRRTVQALTEVEAFSLAAEDLKSAASQFRRLHSKQLQHTFQALLSAMENMGSVFCTSSVAETLS
ncbi:hypothetical protein YC2023_097635 [Brassica napus]